MVKVFEGTPQEYYMDGYIKDNLDEAKNKIIKDWDFIFVCDGEEGSGKSVFAMQLAFYCDPTLSFSRYAFTPSQFKKAIFNAKQYEAVVYDESHSGLNARATMSLINRSLVSMLTKIRQKNLFVFILLPTFFDLDKYVALWRSRALIHIYTGNDMERGYFKFYGKKRKKYLYLLGKKYYDYEIEKPDFYGRFTHNYCLDEKEYRRLKYSTVSEDYYGDEIKKLFEDMLFERIVKLGEKLTLHQKLAILGLSTTQYYYRLKAWTEFNETAAKEALELQEVQEKELSNIENSDSNVPKDHNNVPKKDIISGI